MWKELLPNKPPRLGKGRETGVLILRAMFEREPGVLALLRPAAPPRPPGPLALLLTVLLPALPHPRLIPGPPGDVTNGPHEAGGV